MPNTLIHSFQSDISHIDLPSKFTYPFIYEPHAIAKIAVKELTTYLQENENWFIQMGVNQKFDGEQVGKMFGVLVVENQEGKLVHLWAVSGKLSDNNPSPQFVPPIVDIMEEESFYRLEEPKIIAITNQISELENSGTHEYLKQELLVLEQKFSVELNQLKEKIVLAKKVRAQIRTTLEPNSPKILELNQESMSEKFELKKLKEFWTEKINSQVKLQLEFHQSISDLKKLRREMSSNLQQQIFDRYQFLNFNLEVKALSDCFLNETNTTPPAGSGDCAAPKLMQYAYEHKLKPIALAEFWWGKSPKSEVRKHLNYYPACKGKCQPILTHMLEGLEVDENPLLARHESAGDIEIIYEDDHILAINKPINLLSAPGRTVEDSVHTRVQALYPEITGPIMVHRLDMGTSGILLCAKTKDVHKKLQHQFKSRFIHKKYSALLDGLLTDTEGEISLPLIVDWDNRPMQKVCFETGKKAVTKWEIVEEINGITRVNFYPITGRTHQLRVHAAHPQGLNTAILGDKLYGKPKGRMCLHAQEITFEHPITREELHLICEPDF